MLKIVIQNPESETIIHNVYPDELPFWRELLQGAVKGKIRVENVFPDLCDFEPAESFFPEDIAAPVSQQAA